MNKEIKVSRKAKSGKTITKGVPENLLTLYLKQGWVIEEKKKESKPSFSNKEKIDD